MTQYTPAKLRALARIVRAEREVTRVTLQALTDLAAAVDTELDAGGWTATVMDNRAPVWRTQLTEQIMPAIAKVYDQGYRSELRDTAVTAAVMPGGEQAPGSYGLADHRATQYLQDVHNRMTGVADDVFRVIAAALEAGRQATFTLDDGTTVVGESIPELAARVRAVLADNTRWSGDAVRVARTEVIAANNAGAHAAAYTNAELFGASSTQVQKEWLATADARTRRTHQDADGQVVLGLDTPFSVGGSQLQQPGDPAAPAGEVINCRCTAFYHYPGDPEYQTALTAAATPQEDPMSEPAPETPAPEDTPPTDGPTHAGLAVQATDTGRILMLQRALDPEDPAAGKWEFPGGSIEPGETPLEGACREWTEETGMVCPEPDITGGWTSPDGVYEAFVAQVPTESALALNPDAHAGDGNPDDPDRLNPEVTAWLSQEDITAMGEAIRQEVRDGTQWDQFLPTPETAVPAPDMAGNALLAANLRLQGLTYASIATFSGFSSATEARAAVTALVAAADPGQMPEDTPPAEGDQPPALAQDIPADGPPWHGILAPEDVTSGDNRQFAADSIIARDLPLPLMYQDATEEGHNGAVRVGRIDQVWRDTTTYAKPMIRYSGVWDTSDIAQEAMRQVEARVLRGVSIDGDQVTAQLIGSDGAIIDPMADMAPADGVVIEQCIEARVSGGTLCSVPAFQQAYLANGVYDPAVPEPGQDEVAGVITPLPDAPEALAAAAAWAEDCAPAWSLVASAGDEAWVMPAAHFTDPELTEATALTVDEDGRVYGHLATWGQCHLNGAAGRRGEQVRAAGKCMEVPMSAANYAYFATGVVHTDAGSTINVGQLTMNTGHANLRFGARDAVDHYDNTGAVVADVTIGHDTIGIWYSGHLRPDATQAQVHALTASGSVSGDWREVIRRSGQLELVAALVVNTPGFPIGRPALTASAHGPTALVASGAITPETMAHRTGQATVEVSDEAVAAFAGRVMAHMARTQRITAARTRVRTHHAAALAQRLNGRTS